MTTTLRSMDTTPAGIDPATPTQSFWASKGARSARAQALPKALPVSDQKRELAEPGFVTPVWMDYDSDDGREGDRHMARTSDKMAEQVGGHPARNKESTDSAYTLLGKLNAYQATLRPDTRERLLSAQQKARHNELKKSNRGLCCL